MSLITRSPFDATNVHLPASASPTSGTYAWIDGLIPVFAFTRLVKSLLRQPQAEVKIPAARFPEFDGDGLRHIVSFGDSYTSTDFDPRGKQPRPDDPLGNPPYPGRTFANGPNWIDQLTVQYNQSYIETLNFAIGGAILDRSAIGPYDYRLYDGGASPSVQDEILSTFIPSYGDSPARFKWTSESTLFTTFVGINDVSMVWWAPNRTAIYDESFRTYSEVLDTLYQTGARNFLALNVPPFYRSPGSKGANWTAAQYDHYDQGIREWNDRLIKTITNLTTVYADVRAGVIDTYTLFDAAQNYPCSNALTCPIRAPDEYCWPSDPVDIGQYGRDEGCRWFADQYFWRDAWHPSWRVHEMLADAIARLLWRLDD